MIQAVHLDIFNAQIRGVTPTSSVRQAVAEMHKTGATLLTWASKLMHQLVQEVGRQVQGAYALKQAISRCYTLWNLWSVSICMHPL